MKRGRKPKDDSALVLAVRARAPGVTVLQACEKFRKQHGGKGDMPKQLKKRYEQFQSHYVWSDPSNLPVYDRRSLLIRMYSKPGLVRMAGASLALSRSPANKKRA